MNRSRDEFLPCAGLAGDEHRRLADSDLARTRERRHQRWRGANDLLEHRGFVDFLTQGDIFLPESLLSGLAIVDIGTGYIPADDLPFVIANRVGTSQEPAVTSIAPAQPQLQLVGRARRDRTIKIFLLLTSVIGMNECTAFRRLPPLF
jgi:hypothetical protein